VCGVFIHPAAADDTKIYDFNYAATKLAIARAMKNEPAASEVTEKRTTTKHLFSPK
jgi:5,6,7,8-tetrahydromethanopterin hydro-lyase